jgi:hypothetical protein
MVIEHGDTHAGPGETPDEVQAAALRPASIN